MMISIIKYRNKAWHKLPQQANIIMIYGMIKANKYVNCL